MSARGLILCALAGVGATAALFAAIPMMNRPFQGKPPEPGRTLRWIALPKKPPEPAAPPRAERKPPERRSPSPPRRIPRVAAAKAAPARPRAGLAAPVSPLRVEPWELGPAAAGDRALFVPPVAEPPASGRPDASEVPAADPAQVYLPSEVDVLPRAVRRVLPDFPSRALSRGIEGHVLIGFVVDRAGTIGEIKVLEWTGSQDFVAPAVDALKRWTFEPGSSRGVAVAVRLSQRFLFREQE